ncbi:hypothetical protein KMC53_gp61 [Klebsiella phage LASTA]|uniref:WDGH domain-containing protein n=2 Tax=Lastavirus lasta TaxID=2845090 RepID=A0A6H0X3G1_9CAUD|nr:hypothetical protein KMC53_gp61 [Klebsiella phage LASTA]QIW86688.1 hypothetical protein 24149LASTA_00061 [Klebsiella phage LASTA]QIW86764.1 hypothetical protein 24147SJM3_00061 [Klebsiella phage SJM3]
MTTENIVQDTEESRIAQQKRETLHSLLYIMAECAPSAEKFMGIDVKALARKVDEAYDQLGIKITIDDGEVSPLKVLLDTRPGDNVLAMYAGSTGEKTVCAEEVRLGSSFKASKKEYADMPERLKAINVTTYLEELRGDLVSHFSSIPDGSINYCSLGMTLAEYETHAEKLQSAGLFSDGYHTFEELYAHRVRLFSALMSAHEDKAWWSHRHHDGSKMDGWIIAGIKTPVGMVTYHLPESEIPNLPAWLELDRGMQWDGHTADDVLERLKSL